MIPARVVGDVRGREDLQVEQHDAGEAEEQHEEIGPGEPRSANGHEPCAPRPLPKIGDERRATGREQDQRPAAEENGPEKTQDPGQEETGREEQHAGGEGRQQMLPQREPDTERTREQQVPSRQTGERPRGGEQPDAGVGPEQPFADGIVLPDDADEDRATRHERGQDRPLAPLFSCLHFVTVAFYSDAPREGLTAREGFG